MKLLFVVPYVPSPVRVRPFNFIRALAARGHTITLFTLVERADEQPSVAEMRGWGVDVRTRALGKPRALINTALTLPTPRPLQLNYCWHPGLAADVQRALIEQRYDAVHVEHLRGARYALAAKRRAPGLRVIWDSVDSITYLFEQAARRSQSLPKKLITRLDLGRTRRFERWMPAQVDHTLVTSSIDADALRKLAPAGAAPHISVVQNGVDLAHFAPGDATRQPASLVFSGKMSYHANITAVRHFAAEILPRVWQARPDATLTVVGKDPSPEIQALAERHPGRVRVTGTVSNVAEYLRTHEIAVVPIVYGAGVQNKVLEAMACRTPAVVSAQAVAALDPSIAQAVRIASDDAAFAGHVLALLNSSDARAQLAQTGREFVERHHSWDAFAAQLESIYAG
jgi:polysaccharide biosynthesis protein PslH